MKLFYLKQIEEATSVRQLEYICEDANKKIESNEDYAEIYAAALMKAKSWQPL